MFYILIAALRIEKYPFHIKVTEHTHCNKVKTYPLQVPNPPWVETLQQTLTILEPI